MSNTYSMQELMAKWNCTKPGAEKKVKKYKIEIVPITFYGVSENGYIVPDDLLERVKKEIESNKKKYFKTGSNKNVSETEDEYLDTDFETIDEEIKPFSAEKTQENIQQFFANIIENVSETHKEHLRDVKLMFEERLKEKTNLLTTFENKDAEKDDEIIELRAKNKYLTEKKSMLEKELSEKTEELKNKKTFFGFKIGK